MTTAARIPIDTVRRADAEAKAKGENPCFLCGKETRGERFIHLHVDGYLVPATVELSEGDDQGWFPIGPECAKKVPAEFVDADPWEGPMMSTYEEGSS